MSGVETIRLEEARPGVGLIRFADPERNNNVCWATANQLAEALEACVERGFRVAVLASDLPGHWFEHAWLTDLLAGIDGEPTTAEGEGWFRALEALSRGPLVTIAAITGDTCGGGCELGWACDLRVAERQARFSQPEVRLGIPPGVGGVSRLASLVGRSLAGEMVFDGGWVAAERLHAAGAINRLVEQGQGLESALSWAAEMAGRPPAALAACKRILAEAQELPLTEAVMNEQRIFWTVAPGEEARRLMAEQQAAYDRGESIGDAFD
jgi:enoyl-CoA hydratase/carnithine racemase